MKDIIVLIITIGMFALWGLPPFLYYKTKVCDEIFVLYIPIAFLSFGWGAFITSWILG
jgi:hypothetical protein